MSVTRILCEKCGVPLCYCKCALPSAPSEGALRESTGPAKVVAAVALGSASSTRDITEDEEYEKFVESMVQYCRCTGQPRPCDGVLAGGLCDNIHDDREWGDDDIMGEHLDDGGTPCS